MVTEGDSYKDTQWKLTTNNPIIIGTTALVFEQNSAFAFGNIYANGTAVLAEVVGDTVTFTAGNNVILTGNATSDTVNFAFSESPSFTGIMSVTGNITGGNITTSNFVTAGNVNLLSRGIVYLYDSDSSHYTGFRSPGTLTGNYIYQLPTSYGNNTQVLTTNGAGGLTWEDAGSGGGQGATSYPNSTVQPVPGATGNFDLSYNFAQTVQEVPFEAAGTDAFGVNLGEVYSMMDPTGEVLDPVDLGVLT
jgi:hypothetical protein